MRLIARQVFRPTLVLPGLYLASVGLFAVILPPRPYAEFRVRITEDRLYELVGLSPDGTQLATRQGWHGPRGEHYVLTEPNTIWVWDLADAVSRGVATGIVQELPDPQFWKHRIDGQPNWQRLFWEILLAPNPYGEYVRIFGGRRRQLGNDNWLSPDSRVFVIFRWPDHPGIGPPEPGPVYFVFDRGTLCHHLRIPRHEHILAIGPDAAWVTTYDISEQPRQIIVRRRDVSGGRELTSIILKGATGKPEVQSSNGRWIIAGDKSRRVGFRWVHRDLWVYDAETGERQLQILGDGIHHFARQGNGLVQLAGWKVISDLQFFDLPSGQQTGSYRPYIYELESIPPDGETVAVTSYEDITSLSSRWPWMNSLLYRCGLLSDKQRYELTLLDAATGAVRARLPGGSSTADDCPQQACFSADGRRLAVLSGDSIVRVWDLPLRKPWARILLSAALPPVVIGLLRVAIQLLRRCRVTVPA